jgi:TonB family protein
MFKFDKSDVQRIAVSSVGAMALSAACIFGVAGPAHAETAQVKTWKNAVEKQLDADGPVTGANDKVSEARVAVRFDSEGRYAGATLVKSSRDEEFDRVALRTARTLDYPALPAAGQTVVVRLLNGASSQRVAMERTKEAMAVQFAAAGTGSAKVNAK